MGAIVDSDINLEIGHGIRWIGEAGIELVLCLSAFTLEQTSQVPQDTIKLIDAFTLIY
jgi:hypothetical protein